MTLDNSEVLVQMAHEVLMNARKNPYTPEQVADVLNIMACKASYFYGNDLNDEDLLLEVYVPTGFSSAWNGAPGVDDPKAQIAQQMYMVDNAKMVPTHQGTNQVVWFMDATHARMITRMHDMHTYKDNDDTYSGYGIYIDDYEKGEDGIWRMKVLRLDYGSFFGDLRYD